MADRLPDSAAGSVMVLAFEGKCVAEGDETVADARARGADADTQVMSDFWDGAFAEVAQEHRFALLVGESGEGIPEPSPDVERVSVVRVIDVVVVADPDAEVAMPGRFEAADPVDRPAVRDGPQPGQQVGTGGVPLARVEPQVEEGFVDDVISEVGVDDDRRHEPAQSDGMVSVGRGAEASVPLHRVSRHRSDEPRRGRFAA